jgi:two-component system nitrate/nitrite sensor histidine kinase NarX
VRATGLRKKVGERELWADLRRLKILSVALPITFVVVGEIFRYILIENDPVQRAENVALAVILVVAVLAFSATMFYFIERAQQAVLRQNRELAAVNAVSTAVQGELGVEEVIDAALESVIVSTGATEASVTVFPREHGPRGEGAIERRIVFSTHESPLTSVGAAAPHLIDIPLSVGPTVVGRMRLHLRVGDEEPDLLESATLQNIGHQLASSIQMTSLIGDLQRRRLEGHAFYDILLQVSNQHPIADVLGSIVRHGRELLQSDTAVMCLTHAASRQLVVESGQTGLVAAADGTVCVSTDPERARVIHERSVGGPVRAETDLATTIQVRLETGEGSLGDLLVGRTEDRPYTERDRGFLRTLAGFAAIAITAERMREGERQGAIVAERERIAREMHDSLAQVLGVTHLRLRALSAQPEVGALPEIEREIEDLADIQEEAYRDVREALLGLREASKPERGLMEGLRAFLVKYTQQSGVIARLDTDLDREPPLSPRAEVQIIRVIQESLTNVRKHSGARTAVVRIASSPDATTIVIEDDGHGFDLGGTLMDRDGFGLHSMRERMELIGGTLTIDSAPGRGTRVIARVPVPPYATPAPVEVTGAGARQHPDPAGR